MNTPDPLKLARDALKPCPHCGLTHTLKLTTAQELAEEGEDDPEPWMHSDSWAVICDMSRPDGPGGCGASGGFYPSEAEAIEAWNRRAAIDAMPASVPSGEPAAMLIELERVATAYTSHRDNVAGIVGAMRNWLAVRATTAPAAPAPAALLVRDLAASLRTEPLVLCKLLAALGYGEFSVNMAVPANAAGAVEKHFTATPAPAAVPARVYLVATGETHNGLETYTRHDDAPPPLCDAERLFTAPAVAAHEPQGVTRIDLGFRWDGERQQHVPNLLIEFEPVPANGPCDAKGWRATMNAFWYGDLAYLSG